MDQHPTTMTVCGQLRVRGLHVSKNALSKRLSKTLHTVENFEQRWPAHQAHSTHKYKNDIKLQNACHNVQQGSYDALSIVYTACFAHSGKNNTLHMLKTGPSKQ